jgi:hypothetical protein
VALFELGAHCRKQPAQQRLCKCRELLACALRGDSAREKAGGDEELLLLADDAGPVDDLLIVAGIAQE